MRNPDLTREKILRRAALLFNTSGYKSTSLSQITKATGFTKGAIYQHFQDKEDLEKKTLYFLSNMMFEKVRLVIKSQETAVKKMVALFSYFETYISDSPIKGGCPLLNAAIESDDANPTLRKEAVKILDILRDSIIKILENGIRFKQIKSEIDKDFYATLIIASLEGAIMMSKLRGNDSDIKKVTKHLKMIVKQIET